MVLCTCGLSGILTPNMDSLFAYQFADLENIDDDNVKNNVRVQHDIKGPSSNIFKYDNPQVELELKEKKKSKKTTSNVWHFFFII